MRTEPEQSRRWEMESETMAIILRHHPDLQRKTLQEARAVLMVDYTGKNASPPKGRLKSSRTRHRKSFITLAPSIAYRKLAESCLLESEKTSLVLRKSLLNLARLYIRTAEAIEEALEKVVPKPPAMAAH
jgi:hypothetical protein